MKKDLIKKKNKWGLLILLLLVTIGYAILSTNVGIKGTSKIKDARWDIHLENIVVSENSVVQDTNPEIDSTRTKVTYQANLNIPGDFYEFSVDVVNAGSLDAMIDNVLSKIKIDNEDFVDITDNTLPKYLKYQVTYSNGSNINKHEELNSGERRTYKIRIEYNKDIDVEDLPQEEKNFEFDFSVNYVQKDKSSKEVNELDLGKYVEITPELTSYTILKEDSGTNYDQVINPSELSLWRIIKVNEDGSFDAVSHYASSEEISFKGSVGYQKIVNTLKNISTSYINSNYITNTRMMGYNNQRLTINNFLSITGENNPPVKIATPLILEGSGEEYQDGFGGDNLYIKDYQLVKNIYKNESNNYGTSGLIAYDKGGNKKNYFLSSRILNYNTNSKYNYSALKIDTSGILDKNAPLYSYNSSWEDKETSSSIRPIITIKKDVEIKEGKGSKTNPYILI